MHQTVLHAARLKRERDPFHFLLDVPELTAEFTLNFTYHMHTDMDAC